MIQIKKTLTVLLLALFVFTLSSCNKKEEIIEALTESEVVEILEAALQNGSGGLTTNLENMAEELVNAAGDASSCDSLYSTTIDEEYQGNLIQSSYNSDITYEISCNAFNIPSEATFSSSTDLNYSTNRIESIDNSVFSGDASGLQGSSTTINLLGNYRETGTQVLIFSNQKQINSTFDVDLSTLQISKQGFDIESGVGSFSFTGTVDGSSFSYTGSIVFNDNKTASLTINGTTYDIDWN